MIISPQIKAQLNIIFPDEYSDVWVVSDSKQMVARLLTSGYLNDPLNPPTGNGDMTRAVYDPDGDNIVDVSERSNTQEDNLGLPDQDDYILASDTAGVRTWIPLPTPDKPGFIEETGLASYTPDFKNNFFVYTTTSDSAFLDPINIEPGMNGTLVIRQNASVAGHVSTWGASYVFPEGDPVLNTDAGWVHIFEYRCISDTEVVMEFVSSH